MQTAASSLALIQSAYPDRVLLSLKEAAAIIGFTARTLHNMKSDHRLPFPSVKVGGKRMIRVVDLASFIDGQVPDRDLGTGIPTPARGRPRKTAATMQAALSLEGGAA